MSAWESWRSYPRSRTVAQRRADADRALARGGALLAPIAITGRKITSTFWGDAWCQNLERYQDFSNRLARGRSYVRSGAVIDLAIEPGRVRASVLGSRPDPYEVEIAIEAVAAPAWKAIIKDCAGSIASLVDLLAGKLSGAVMERLCAEGTGLFPRPAAIGFECSCPDHAVVCKHVAAVMYGIGARLDREPALLFTLRRVTADELLASAARVAPGRKAPRSTRILGGDLSSMFGIELAEIPAPRARKRARR